MGSDTRVHIQMGSDGQEVNDNLNAAMARPDEKPNAAPLHRQGGIVHRLQMSEDGTAEYTTSEAKGARVTAPAARPFALNDHGQSVDISQAGPKSVVNLGPELGDSTAQAWEAAGMLRKADNGQGYVLAGLAAEQAEKAQKTADKPEAKKQEPPVDPNDVQGVPPTSPSSDRLMTALSTHEPAKLEQIISTIAKGDVPDFAAMGSEIGDEGFAQAASQAHGEFIASGQAALSRVGVEDHADFQAWAIANDPEALNDAVRDVVSATNVRKLQELGKRYVAQATENLARLVQSHGTETIVRDGVAYVSRKSLGLPPTRRVGDFGGQDLMPIKEAIKQGIIEITG